MKKSLTIRYKDQVLVSDPISYICYDGDKKLTFSRLPHTLFLKHLPQVIYGYSDLILKTKYPIIVIRYDNRFLYVGMLKILWESDDHLQDRVLSKIFQK